MSLGRQPLANALVMPGGAAEETFYDLRPAACPACGLFQIVELPAPERAFNADYPFFSGGSRVMTDHFRALATEIRRMVPDLDLIVEIGSNDGTLLRNFAGAGIRHLGIEPAVARAPGVETLEAFFTTETARRIRASKGPADVIVATNVIAHIPDIGDLGRAVGTLLKDDGLFVFEAVYLGDMIATTAFDQLYNEHVFTFSATAVRNVFARHGLDLIDVSPQATQGGSMRYTLAPTGTRPIFESVAATIAGEDSQGLNRPETYRKFGQRCQATREQLVGLIADLRAQGKRIAGYGATGKSATLLNYCRLSPAEIEYIADSTPVKVGKMTPGTRIPIRSPARFAADPPDVALLLAWNHRAEIEAKERAFRDGGGKWIIHVPHVAIV